MSRNCRPGLQNGIPEDLRVAVKNMLFEAPRRPMAVGSADWSRGLRHGIQTLAYDSGTLAPARLVAIMAAG